MPTPEENMQSVRAFAEEVFGMYLVRVNNEGQIAEHWGVVDTIGTMGQLGLLQPPA
jgi:hypothetical protein